MSIDAPQIVFGALASQSAPLSRRRSSRVCAGFGSARRRRRPAWGTPPARVNAATTTAANGLKRSLVSNFFHHEINLASDEDRRGASAPHRPAANPFRSSRAPPKARGHRSSSSRQPIFGVGVPEVPEPTRRASGAEREALDTGLRRRLRRCRRGAFPRASDTRRRGLCGAERCRLRTGEGRSDDLRGAGR